MRKHLAMALAGAISVTTISVSTVRVTYAIGAPPDDTIQTISGRAFGGEKPGFAVATAIHPASASRLASGVHLALAPQGATFDYSSRRAFGRLTPRLDTPPAPGNPDGSGTAPANDPPPAPPLMPLPVLAGPASPDGAPAPGVLPDALTSGPVIQTGLATWYGPGFTGGVTYCGEVYDQWAMTAASNTLPCGTVIVVTNQSSGLSARVRITDRGAFGGSVILDLSRAAFLSIAPGSSGVISVAVALALP